MTDMPGGSLPNAARRPRGRVVLVVIALIVIVVGAVALVVAGPLAGSAMVKVVACPTTYGAGNPAQVSLPASVSEPFLDASAASGLALYVSSDGTYSQLAPTGWICTAGVGADGSWGLDIHPLTDPSAGVLRGGAYNGPGAAQVCTLFDAAASQAPDPAACIRPDLEVVDRVSPGLVRFSDPPRTQSPAQLATTYTVLGAATFGMQSGPDASELVACALPDSSRALCQKVIDATVASWQGRK